MLSRLGNDLREVVRMRPLVSVAVSGDRYSLSYSVTRGGIPPAGTKHLIRRDIRAYPLPAYSAVELLKCCSLLLIRR